MMLLRAPGRAQPFALVTTGTSSKMAALPLAMWQFRRLSVARGDEASNDGVRSHQHRRRAADPFKKVPIALRRMILRGGDGRSSSPPELLLSSWRKVFLMLDNTRVKDKALSEARLHNAVNALAQARTRVQEARVDAREGHEDELKRLSDRVARAERRAMQNQRHVLSRMQMQLIQRRVLRYCRSTHLIAGMARHAFTSAPDHVPRLDAAFINAINELNFFETVRQRFVASSPSVAKASPKSTFRAAMMNPVVNRRGREAIATMLDDMTKPLPHPENLSQTDLPPVAAASLTVEVDTSRRGLPPCLVSGSQAVTLLLLINRLALPIAAETRKALMEACLHDVARLPPKATMSLAVWCTKHHGDATSTDGEGGSVSLRQLEMLRDRVVEIILQSPHVALHGSDALHGILALSRLDRMIMDQSSQPRAKASALRQSNVRFALLRRVLGGRLATPIATQEASEKERMARTEEKLLREDKRRIQALTASKETRVKIKPRANQLHAGVQENVDRKLLRIRREFEKNLDECLNSVFAKVTAAALMQIVEVLTLDKSTRFHGTTAEGRWILQHTEAVTVALALQSLARRQPLVDWSRQLLLATAVLADLEASQTVGGLLTSAVAESIDTALLEGAEVASSLAAKPRLDVSASEAAYLAMSAARALAAIGQLKELGFFNARNHIHCTSKVFGAHSGDASLPAHQTQALLRDTAANLLRVLSRCCDANKELRNSTAEGIATTTGPQLQLAADGLRSLGMLTPVVATVLGIRGAEARGVKSLSNAYRRASGGGGVASGR